MQLLTGVTVAIILQSYVRLWLNIAVQVLMGELRMAAHNKDIIILYFSGSGTSLRSNIGM